MSVKFPKELVYYSDPGHGYLRVPLKLIKMYGLCNKISGYSFKSKEYAFLEEDCDAALFLKAIKENGNEDKYKIVEKVLDRPAACRNYPRF